MAIRLFQSGRKYWRTSAIALFVVVPAVFSTSCSSLNDDDNAEDLTGRFIASYEHAAVSQTVAEEKFLRDRRVLDDFVETMNNYIQIPEDVQVFAKDCGESNAFYLLDEHSINLCYELSAQERSHFASTGKSGDNLDTEVYQSMVATLYHEVGHALIGELDLKITGREEDVADQMAAYILTSDDDSKEYLLTTAASYAISGKQVQSIDESTFADVHSLDEQRAANFLCYVYGSDEVSFQYLVDNGALDSNRAPSCGHEYTQMIDAWQSLLAPFIRP